jgi:hypothetical protein
VEDCRSIDVNQLHKAGCLRPGWWGGWQWTRNGEKVASITLRAEADCVLLSFRVLIGGGEWEETVRIVRVPCRFGGSRAYFICPGVVNGIACGRRVTKLHGPGRYFLCRHCYRPRPYQPERKRMGSCGPTCEQNQTAPRRRPGYSRAVS